MAKQKKVIKAPFTELKVGGKYIYTRDDWPAPQAGTQHVKTVFDAEAVSIPVISKTGQIVHQTFVKLDGGEKLYDLKELPLNAKFTEA